MTLKDIYQAETCPPKTQWLPELIAASRKEIDNFIASENTQGWFLNGIFYHRMDNDDKVYQSIFQHPNCPPRLIAIAQRFKPEWIVGSPALAMIQLGMLDPDGQQEWESTKNAFSQKELAMFIYSGLFEQERRYILNHYTYDKDHFDEVLVLSPDRFRYIDYRQGLMRNLFALTPQFIFDAFADEEKTPITLAAFQPLNVLAKRLADMKVTELEFVTQRDDLTIEIQHFLASHKSLKVRKKLAENKWTDETILLQLAQDLNNKVAETAKKKLSKERLDELNQTLTQTALNNHNEDGGTLVDLLRIKAVPTEALVEIATTAEPLWCCAATLHQSAQPAVINAAAKRGDLPNWAKMGIALHTQDAAQIDALIATDNKDLWLALSDNPNLSVAQAETLIVKSNDEIVWCGIANTFIDNPKIIGSIINQRNKKSLWQTHLKMMLDPNTRGNDIVKIQRNTTPHGDVFSRLLARHERCPINFIIRLGAYFPQDTKFNTKYALKLLEAPGSVQPEKYSDWKIEELLTSGQGFNFLYQWVVENITDERDIRRCISAPRMNPNKVRHLAISASDDTLRRFVAPTAREFSPYEYRMLATLGNATTLKSLIKSERLDNDLLKELLEHSDSTVKTQAVKLAKKRKLNMATASAVKKSSRQNSLGNKAERIELAKETSDLALLTILAGDKTRDVREQVTQSEHVSTELLLLLAADKDELVIQGALISLSKCDLSEPDHASLQQILKDILVNHHFSERMRTRAARDIKDGTLLASQFTNGTSELDKVILANSDCSEFLEKAFFAAQRGDKNIRYRDLVRNPHMSLEMKLRLPYDNSPHLINEVIHNTRSAQEIIALYQQHEKLIVSSLKNIGITHRKPEERDTFSRDEIMALFNSIHPVLFCNLVNTLLSTLDLAQLKQVATSLVNNVSDTDFSRCTTRNRYFSEPAVDFLRELLMTHKFMNSLEDVITQYPISEVTIDRLLDHDYEPIHHALAFNRHLNNGQINQLIGHKDSEVRDNIARYQPLDDDQLSRLCHDSKLSVIYNLASSEQLDLNRLPTWALCKASQLDGWNYDRERILRILQSRGIESDQAVMTLPQILTHFDMQMSVQRFNKELIDKGLVEIVDTVNSYDEAIRKKCFVEKCYHYGHDTEYPADKFTPVFYPYNFSELLALLEIEVKEPVS